MNILYYISGYDGCGYYRLNLPARFLNKVPDVHAKISNKYSISEISWADIIVLQKQTNLDAMPFLNKAKELGKKIVHECDDDYFNIEPWNPAYKFYHGKEQDLISFYKKSDLITVTTPHLADVIFPHNPNVAVLPNSLDISYLDTLRNLNEDQKYENTFYMDVEKEQISRDKIFENRENKIFIGWGGSPTHSRDLDQATPALIKICKENPNIILFMMGCSTSALLDNIPKNQMILVGPVPVFLYHKVLASLNWDIGICPIVDNTFNRSKSNLKFLEHSVNGYASICSDVENYSKTVIHGETGLLTKNTDQDWYSNLKILVEDKTLRNRISEQGQQFVKKEFDIANNYVLWLNAYKSLLGEK